MKKLIVVLSILLAATPAVADNFRHGPRHGHHHNHYGWVAPLIAGGAIGYILSQPRVVYVPQYAPQPPYAPPYGYHWETLLDASCNCYRTVLVQN